VLDDGMFDIGTLDCGTLDTGIDTTGSLGRGDLFCEAEIIRSGRSATTNVPEPVFASKYPSAVNCSNA